MMNQPLKHLAYGPMGSRLKPSNFADPHLHFKLQGAFSTSSSEKKTVSFQGRFLLGLATCTALLMLGDWMWNRRLNCMEVELVIQVEHLQSGEASGGYPHMISEEKCRHNRCYREGIGFGVLVREQSTENQQNMWWLFEAFFSPHEISPFEVDKQLIFRHGPHQSWISRAPSAIPAEAPESSPGLWSVWLDRNVNVADFPPLSPYLPAEGHLKTPQILVLPASGALQHFEWFSHKPLSWTERMIAENLLAIEAVSIAFSPCQILSERYRRLSRYPMRSSKGVACSIIQWITYIYI